MRGRKIHTAEELFLLAQEQGNAGDLRLLLYCSGTGGMKRNLQATVNNIWTPDGGVPAGSAAHAALADPRHLAPLTEARLRDCKQRARQLPKGQQALGGVDVKVQSRKGLSRILHAGTGAGAQSPVQLFDQYGTRAEVVVRPRSGIWRLRDFYEVLVACRGEAALEGVAPSAASEGGFSIPRTEAGWHAMLRAGVATPRAPFSELTPAQRTAAAADVRFSLACGALRWRPPGTAQGSGASTAETWIDAMPCDPSFEVDTLVGMAWEEQLVRLWANNHVEDRHWLAILRAFEACRHTVQQTSGFKVKRGNMLVSGSKVSTSRHKHGATIAFGALCAQACVAEVDGEGQQSRQLLFHPGRSGRQTPACEAQPLLALADAAGCRLALAATAAAERPKRKLRRKRSTTLPAKATTPLSAPSDAAAVVT